MLAAASDSAEASAPRVKLLAVATLMNSRRSTKSKRGRATPAVDGLRVSVRIASTLIGHGLACRRQETRRWRVAARSACLDTLPSAEKAARQRDEPTHHARRASSTISSAAFSAIAITVALMFPDGTA